MTPERMERLLRVLGQRQAALTVVMENVHDPHNVSAVMRTCDAVGIQDIYILNTIIPKHDSFGPKSSSGAAKWMTVHQYDNAAECFAVVRKQYDRILTTHLSADAVEMYDVDFTEGSLALVFGNEHGGVSDEIRGMSDGNFIIPQMGVIRSLNVSVACAVTLYEALRQRKAAGLYNRPSLSAEKTNILLNQWGLDGASL